MTGMSGEVEAEARGGPRSRGAVAAMIFCLSAFGGAPPVGAEPAPPQDQVQTVGTAGSTLVAHDPAAMRKEIEDRQRQQMLRVIETGGYVPPAQLRRMSGQKDAPGTAASQRDNFCGDESNQKCACGAST